MGKGKIAPPPASHNDQINYILGLGTVVACFWHRRFKAGINRRWPPSNLQNIKTYGRPIPVVGTTSIGQLKTR